MKGFMWLGAMIILGMVMIGFVLGSGDEEKVQGQVERIGQNNVTLMKEIELKK